MLNGRRGVVILKLESLLLRNVGLDETSKITIVFYGNCNYCKKNQRSAVKLALYQLLSETFLTYYKPRSYVEQAMDVATSTVNHINDVVCSLPGVYVTGTDRESCYVACDHASLDNILLEVENFTDKIPLYWEIVHPEKDGIITIEAAGGKTEPFPHFNV